MWKCNTPRIILDSGTSLDGPGVTEISGCMACGGADVMRGCGAFFLAMVFSVLVPIAGVAFRVPSSCRLIDSMASSGLRISSSVSGTHERTLAPGPVTPTLSGSVVAVFEAVGLVALASAAILSDAFAFLTLASSICFVSCRTSWGVRAMPLALRLAMSSLEREVDEGEDIAWQAVVM